MSFNMGLIDRILRIVVGLYLLAYAWTSLDAGLLWIATAVGAVLTVTAMVGVCPAYSLFGISTRPSRLKGT